MTEMEASDGQTILGQHNAALKEYNHCIGAVLKPIKDRLEDLSQNAFTEFWTDPIIQDDSLKMCGTAKQRVDQIDKLVTRAASQGEQLAPVSELERQLLLTDLKRRLAWSLEADELKKALGEASIEITKGSGDGTLQVLYEQATKRAVVLSQKMVVVSSPEQRSKELESFMASLSTVDDMKVDQLSEFSQIFSEILELNQKFHRFGIKKILNEREAGGIATMDLPEYGKESEKIRTAAKNAINSFIEKADQFSVSDPETAQNWFEPVKLFEKFLLKDEDKDFIDGIRDTEQMIADNLAHWQQADSLLKDAKERLLPTDDGKPWEEQSFWDACQLVHEAEQAYQAHTDIDDLARACITHIVRMILVGIASHRKDCEQQWAVNEARLVCPPDWEELWLKTNDLPAWLKRDQQMLEIWFSRIDTLEQTLAKKLGSDCIARHEKLIKEGVSEIRESSQQDDRALAEIVDRRKAIREFIIRTQDFIRQGSQPGNQSLYQEAERQYQLFLGKNLTWHADAELQETSKLLLSYLNASQILKKACGAYRDANWIECITDCETMVSQDAIQPLEQEVDVTYVSTRLQSGLNESLVADDVHEFARVLLQLAYVNQAAIEIERCARGEFYTEMDPYLKQIETYGQGQSPIVIAKKDSVHFEDYKADYSTRKAFGDDNYLEGGTVNELAIRYAKEYERLVSSTETSATWLSSAQANLNHFASLDSLKQSLWVGDARESKKKLGNLFLKHLKPYLASLAGSTLAPVSSTVEQAFSFLQTARRDGFYLYIDVHTRRWITYRYYLIQEEKYIGDYANICANWRAAVEDFSDDEEIVRKFRSVAWTWWLAELDAALLEMANGQDANVKLTDLFNQNTSNMPDLFSPVRLQNGSLVKPELDRYHDEILRRQASQKAMQAADADLASNPDSLPVVLRELRDAMKELNRVELEVKSSNLAAAFTKHEVAIANGLVKKGYPVDATEHYLRAYALQQWDGAQKWLETGQDNIRQYWRRLQDDIEQFKEKEGSIFAQRKAALQYSIRLEELRKCNFCFSTNQTFPPKAEMDKIATMLLEKTNLLDLGVTNLNRFLPSGEEWRKAANPKERSIVVMSSWGQLENYLYFLKFRFGDKHQQVEPLSKLVMSMKDNVTALYEGADTLRQVLEETEEYGNCLATCRKINDSVDNLCTLEPQYYNLWGEWLRNDEQKQLNLKDNSIRFYPDHAAAYGEWKFKHGKRELPYYLDGLEFRHWREGLLTYTLPPERGEYENQFQQTYQFNDELFFLYLSGNAGLIGTLRQAVNNGEIFLGNFLELAYVDKKTWEKHDRQFDFRINQYVELKGWLAHQDENKITALRSIAYAAQLLDWIHGLQALLKEDQPIAESAQKTRIKIAQAVRSGDQVVDNGELNQSLSSVNERIDLICSKEKTQVARFYKKMDEVNRGIVSDEVLDNITALKRMYENGALLDDQRARFDNLKIPIDQVESIYQEQYKPRHDFFEYVESVAGGSYA